MVVLILGSGLLVAGDTPRWQPELAVVDHDTAEVVWSAPVDVGDRFRMEHIHSVHGRPVIEIFAVAGPAGLAMEEMRFDATGANLPSGPEQIGDVTTTFINEGDHFRVLHHGRILGELPLRVGGSNVDHTLVLPDGHSVRLLDIAPRGTYVELRVRGVPAT